MSKRRDKMKIKNELLIIKTRYAILISLFLQRLGHKTRFVLFFFGGGRFWEHGKVQSFLEDLWKINTMVLNGFLLENTAPSLRTTLRGWRSHLFFRKQTAKRKYIGKDWTNGDLQAIGMTSYSNYLQKLTLLILRILLMNVFKFSSRALKEKQKT